MALALTSCCRFSSNPCQQGSPHSRGEPGRRAILPECVMFRSAPVALRCTLMSLDLASRVKGPKAPERAILALFSSCVARFVMQPTALHWTSTLVESICLIRGWRPPICTIKTLFSAVPVGCQQRGRNRVGLDTHCSRQDCQARRLQPSGLRCQGFLAKTESARGCHGRLREHLPARR